MKTQFVLRSLLSTGLWASVLASVWAASAQAGPQALSWFASACSGQATAVAVGSDTHFVTQLQGLSSGHRIELRARFAPDGATDEAAAAAQESVWQITADDAGRARFELEFKPPSPQPGQPRAWTAQAVWRDLTLPALTGNTAARIYLALSGEEQLYALEAPATCEWSTVPRLMHPYRVNRSAYSVAIEQEVELNWLTPEQGVDLGAINGTYPTRGWFFPRWEGLYGAGARKVKQTWQLPMNAGGFLADRVRFTRYSAREFSRVRNRGCWDWTAGRRGTLDVGARVTDFYLVPAADAATDAQAIHVIEAAYPRTDTCDSRVPRAALEDRVPMSSEDYPLYFLAQ